MSAAESDDATTGRPKREPRATALRWAALLSPLVVPWLVVRTGATTLVFPWGSIVVETGRVAPVTAFLGGPGPRHLELWPLAAACYGAALAWAAVAGPHGVVGGRGRADGRVVAGLFVLVAIATARMAAGFGVDPNRTAVPLGSLHALVLAVRLYRSDGRGYRND